MNFRTIPLLVVGGVGNIRKRLQLLDIPAPIELDYPDELQPFLGSIVMVVNLNDFAYGGNNDEKQTSGA